MADEGLPDADIGLADADMGLLPDTDIRLGRCAPAVASSPGVQ